MILFTNLHRYLENNEKRIKIKNKNELVKYIIDANND